MTVRSGKWPKLLYHILFIKENILKVALLPPALGKFDKITSFSSQEDPNFCIWYLTASYFWWYIIYIIIAAYLWYIYLNLII